MSGASVAVMADGSGFAPVTTLWDGTTGTETVPTGATNVVIEGWGPGGGGGRGGAGVVGGGGSGSYSIKTMAVSGGQTFSVTGTAGGIGKSFVNGSGTTSTASTITGTATMTVNAGLGGLTGGGSAGGAAGTGGDTNTAGNTSVGIEELGAGAPSGGGDVVSGVTGSTPGGGGGGSTTTGGNGAPSRWKFAYT